MPFQGDGGLWYDVCNALEYENGRKAVADHVDGDDVTKRYAWVTTGKQSDGSDAVRKTAMTFVNESGVYSLIFGKPPIYQDVTHSQDMQATHIYRNDIPQKKKNPTKPKEPSGFSKIDEKSVYF